MIPEEKEKKLEEVIKQTDEKEEEKREFRYDKTVSIPPERDPLNFDIQYKDMIKRLIINRFDFTILYQFKTIFLDS